MTILVTGGAGFIGSHFIRYMIEKYPKQPIVNVDVLSYAGNLKNVKDIQGSEHYSFVKGDVTHHELMDNVIRKHHVELIVHFAAESHVDRSIRSSAEFVRTNVMGTQCLLDIAKEHGIRFIQISTDEVYGSLGRSGAFTEESPLKPNSPYSASKAGADCLVSAYYETFGLNVNITRCSNNYGPFQFPEKLIPRMILQAIQEKELPVYGNGENIRDWLHVRDHCSAIDAVIQKGKPGEVYNIGGHNERTNLEIVHSIVDALGKSRDLIMFTADRPGHDFRYSIDSGKIQRELGWSPSHSFEIGLLETITWYQSNEEWWGKRTE
ncbi:dTDP-glucose 4,6-dehydratase [Rossellomorea aquimaris]|uniref:dTDP-glucose 4,6-dehydratase n=1 Tax=Rossellomorea aquimaris TaxID=189382 RepID=UPI001CD2E3EE|nr:dTDP-glucose 4,6-dehydratase [Rossellomorea aquimaris]MCA1060428.1 dTDP-glucose 4,6-dehydratase [Rossellomorea aquimaris]